jgi:hypothetical protein
MLRFHWLTLLAPALAAAIAISVVLCSRPPLVSDANLQRIKVGMTRAEVEATLGKPQEEFFPPSNYLEEPCPPDIIYHDDGLLKGRAYLLVSFDCHGNVNNAFIGRDERTLLARVYDRFPELQLVFPNVKRPWACLLLYCLGLVFAIYLVSTCQSFVFEARLRRIKVGMSTAEVEAILGRPQPDSPDFLSPFELISCFPSDPFTENSKAGIVFYWDNSLLRRRLDCLWVHFDYDGVVDDYRVFLKGPDDRTLWRRLRDRFDELRAWHGW